MANRIHRAESLVERVPPNHEEAEQAVLASMLVRNSVIDEVKHTGLTPSDFYRRANAGICEAIFRVHANGDPVDLISLRDALKAEGVLDEIGGYGYLVDLAGLVPTVAHVEFYAGLVRDKSLLRAQIHNHYDAAAMAFEPEMTPQEVADAFAAKQAGLTLSRGNETASDTDALMQAFWTDLDLRTQQLAGGHRHLLELGFHDVDQHLGGLAPGNFFILGGRPAMGKTALALAFFWNVAEFGRPHLYSLEMTKEELMQRLVAMLSGVDSRRLRSGDIRPGDRTALEQATNEVYARDFVVDDGAGLTLERLRRSVLKDVADGNRPPLVIVDYLQLMDVPHRAENRTQAMGEISRGLKKLAREAGTTIMALSQLSRQCESRPDKRPLMSDLRESGNLEQDADAVAFVYRDEYYNLDSTKKGIVEVIFAKWRHGAVGTVELAFDKGRQKFADIQYAGGMAQLAAPPAHWGPAPEVTPWDRDEGDGHYARILP